MSAVIELKPEKANETLNRANKIYLRGDYAKAGAIAELYLREHPDDPQALRTITKVNLHRGDVSAVTFGANDATHIKVARHGY